MSKYKLSRRSLNKLSLAHPDHQALWPEVIKWTPIDFGIAFTYRTPEEQFELYKKGRKLVGSNWIIENRSKIVTFKDGFKKLSKHNFKPSKAVDIYAYINGKASWDMAHLAAIYGVVMTIAEIMYKEKEMDHRITCGADWNRNGVLVNQDNLESFVDFPHYQIVG